MEHPKATTDAVAEAAKRDFEGEDVRKVAYITDQLKRGTGKDARPVREDADVRLLTESLQRITKLHDRQRASRA